MATSAKKAYLRNTILPAAMQYFAHHLQVWHRCKALPRSLKCQRGCKAQTPHGLVGLACPAEDMALLRVAGHCQKPFARPRQCHGRSVMGQVSRARTRQVIAVQGAVKVTPYCRWSIGGKSCCATHSSCKYDSPNKCHDVEVPASHATSGVAGADFVLCDSPRHDFLEYY